jgi:hypothetical protein
MLDIIRRVGLSVPLPFLHDAPRVDHIGVLCIRTKWYDNRHPESFAKHWHGDPPTSLSWSILR